MKEKLKGDKGEDAVERIISNTFLKYWCYPGPKDELGTNKEICDLLILFEESVIIIEVKNYEFKGNYERYFNKTIKKAISQVKGAERKLFNSNRKLSFTHSLRGTTTFNPKEYKTIHRLIVNLSTVPQFYQAAVTSNEKFIHIFNWFGFLKVIYALNAIPDYIEYLIEREKAFKNKSLVLLFGEENQLSLDSTNQFNNYCNNLNSKDSPTIILKGNELDLLADYLFNGRSISNKIKSNLERNISIDIRRKWIDFCNRKEVNNKILADEKSHFFDKLVIKEVLFYENEIRIEIATILFGFNRFERRIAGLNFHEFISKYKDMMEYSSARRFFTIGKIAIGYFMHGNAIDLEVCMRYMTIAAQGFSLHEGYKSEKVIIIGINSGLTQTKFAYVPEVVKFEGLDLEDLIHNLKTLNWFQNLERIETQIDEYPNE